MSFYAGLDFGTSGARIIVIDDELRNIYERAVVYSSERDRHNPHKWLETLWDLLINLPSHIKACLQRIAIDGTSSTVLICDQSGVPIAPPKMYNEACEEETLDYLRKFSPAHHIVNSATSSFSKLVQWKLHGELKGASFFLHQADWLGSHLHGNWRVSDFHNSLKLGFDPVSLSYPEWFQEILENFHQLLPIPRRPGQTVSHLTKTAFKRIGCSESVEVCAGTTDSIAAFLASEAMNVGDAVTSLGSTIALKLLSKIRVDASDFGVYSHWFGNNWLVGGASNAGGAVLEKFFDVDELNELSHSIDWSAPPKYHYIPLLTRGERFPVNDPFLEPCFSPMPEGSSEFLKELLSSLTSIEREGYKKLQDLGASPLKQIFTAGGGAKNQAWQQWRNQQLGIPISASKHPQAAYGTAKLAWGCLESIH